LIKSSYQLVVIGAGPAGMAAAQAALRYGVEVALFDEQSNPGGQIYRNVDSSPLVEVDLLGHDYKFGQQQVLAFRHSRLDYFAGASVWYLDKSGSLGILYQGRHYVVNAEQIILASGAQERPMPFPGWQKPGVMTAGAGQILLKSAALVPQKAPVLVGSGPLLLLLAWQYLRAGVGVQAIVDTTPQANRWRALRHLPRALAASDTLFKGLQLVMSIKRARVPWHKQATDLRAEGGERVEGLKFNARGIAQQLDTRLVMLHQGVIPALHMAEAAGCETQWNEIQQCWQPRLDNWGESSQSGIFIAGDGAGIGGARAAALSGQLAGLQVAHRLGRVEQSQRDRLARAHFNARQRQLAIRPFLDAFYRVGMSGLVPVDETLVCRCEEVTAAEIRALVAMGCSGPNQAKAFVRCGMGPCQGRFCASTVENIFAGQRAVSVGDIGRFSARPPLKPVTLGQLANIEGVLKHERQEI
jgi:NADPH-dependent 2,4-dienoyl-CoA reductase/sulfur reductase-like enzyme